MNNYFTDNEDILFLFDHLDLPRAARIMEEDFRFALDFESAPVDEMEAMAEYRRILEEFGQLAAEEIAPTAKETDEIGNVLNPDGTVTYAPGIRHALDRMGELGLLGLTLPYKYGGLNCPSLMLTICNDIVSRADASLMNLFGLQGIGETINAFADEDIKRAFLPDMASGRKTGAMVLTEPDSGSDLQSVKVRAEEAADGTWRINGTKRFITNGCGDVLLVMARSEPEVTDGRGLSLFLIEKGPAVEVRRLENKLGIHGSPTCELHFHDAPGRLVGERQMGLIRYVMALMYGARLGIAAQALGIAEAAQKIARQYGHERKQFGTEIETFPAVRELLVESQMDLRAARTLTYFSSLCVDIANGYEKVLAKDEFTNKEAMKKAKAAARTYKRFTGMLTPMSKYYASEMCMRVSNSAISVMGGNGYMHDYPLERIFRDSRITSIYEGTTQMQIVAASSSVMSGAVVDLITDLLDHDWPDEIQPHVDRIRGEMDTLADVIAFVKDHPSQNYRRVHARRIVDIGIILVVASLFADQALVSEERQPLLRYWMYSRMPEIERNRRMILAGEDPVNEEFEALAGSMPVPVG